MASRAVEPFFVEDQGDGWWHCATPLNCVILDGPRPCAALRARWANEHSTYWLVATNPPIEWHGDKSFAEHMGEDSPACHPIAPTEKAIVEAHGWDDVNLDRAFSVPFYPVLAAARTLDDAQPIVDLGAKVTVYRGNPPT